MNKSTRLKVLANFAKMGLAEDKTLYRHLKRWLAYQSVLQGILLNQSFGRLRVGESPNQEEDLQCRFFITAHFGIYPMIIRYLAALYPSKTVVCLVGKQQSLDGLNQLADRYQVKLEFVEVGHSFISLRRCLRHAKAGNVFLSLIDVPLGISDKSEHHLPFFNGTVRARSGLLKLADKMGLEARFILAGWGDETIPLTSYEVGDIEQIFAHFAQHLHDDPHLWDKVVDLHKFYHSDVTPGLYLPFRIKADHFLMELISDKVMRVSPSLYQQTRYLARLNGPPVEFERERQRIHEQTDLFIRHAV